MTGKVEYEKADFTICPSEKIDFSSVSIFQSSQQRLRSTAYLKRRNHRNDSNQVQFKFKVSLFSSKSRFLNDNDNKSGSIISVQGILLKFWGFFGTLVLFVQSVMLLFWTSCIPCPWFESQIDPFTCKLLRFSCGI